MADFTFFASKISVADIAALKAIPEDNLRDNDIVYVRAPSDGATNNLSQTLYRFDSSSTTAEALPFIVQPNTAPGRWILVPNPLVFGDDITGAYTIAIEDHDRTRLLVPTQAENITLPSGLAYNIQVRLVLTAAFTITFVNDGTSVLNLKGSTLTTLNSVATLFNRGNNWYGTGDLV
jgi:hypothetical protein